MHVLGFFTGLLSGTVLGLLGAGGGLLSVPFLHQYGDWPLAQATQGSLIAVWIGALLHWIPIRKNTPFSLSIALALGTGLFAIPLAWIKQSTPSFVILFFFLMICLLSLKHLWKPFPKSMDPHNPTPAVFPAALWGSFLMSFLSTFTGLGGGLVLMPWLLKKFHFSWEKARATSLFVMLFSTTTSFLAQHAFQTLSLPFAFSLSLFLGSLLAFFTIGFLLKKFQTHHAFFIFRKLLFSALICFAIIGMLF